MDYEKAAAEINQMKGGAFNRNYFRVGTYHWRIDKCEAKKTDDGKGKDMIALEGDVVKVLAEGPDSNREGETVVHVQTDRFAYLLKDQLSIAAAVLGVDPMALKADPKTLVDALKAIFPPVGSGAQSIAIGKVIRVNCVPGKKKDGTPIERRYFNAVK